MFIVVVLIWLVVTWRWFISPSATAVDAAPPSDAVVVFVGGRGERLDVALEVVGAGKVGALVIPNGTTATWPQANALCDGRTDVGVEVLCLVPDPDTTRGEARAIAAVATEQGWDTLVVVTSTYHLERATLLLDRCFAGEVTTVEASPGLSVWAWASRLTHEWAGIAKARLLDREC
jgi:uncharacterized SAM-binding protein YcdF (DUF218 family)